MRSTLFADKNENMIPQEYNLQFFLEHFPENEFWRFFVERSRYDYRQTLYRKLYAKLNGLSEEDCINIPINEIEIAVRDLTVGDVYSFAIKSNDKETLHGLNNRFHAKDRVSEKITNLINQQQGWVGFEDNEPGYLSHVSKGFAFIIFSIISNDDFNIDYIKTLHRICTQDVKKMLRQTPGEFRNGGAFWSISKEGDSLPGLIETIDYLKSVENEFSMTGFHIIIKYNDGNIEKISNFSNEDSVVLANRVCIGVRLAQLHYYRYRGQACTIALLK